MSEKKDFDLKAVGDLMNEAYLDGVDTIIGLVNEAFVKYGNNDSMTEEMKQGMGLLCSILQEAQTEVHSTDYMASVTADFLKKAAKRDLANFKKPFFKPKRGKVKV